MSRQNVEIAARQRAAINDLQGPEETMTSPYLDYIRSAREIIGSLLIAREVELAKTTGRQAAARRSGT